MGMASPAQPFERVDVGCGVTAYVRPTDQFKTVTMKVLWRRPLRSDSVTRTALLPLVLRRGTARLPSQLEMARHLENLYGASFSADVTKIGETQAIEFYLEFASDRFLPGHTRLFGEAVHFLADVMLNPAMSGGAFQDDYVAQEKESLRRKIEALINDKRSYAVFRCLEEMCRDEPYSLHRYGRVADLEGITPADLAAFYRQVAAESPVDVFVVGAVDAGQVRKTLAEAFRFSRGQVAALPPAVRRPAAPARTVVEEEDVKQAVLVLGYRLPVGYADDQYPALLLYNGILGAFPSSKLFVNVREKASLAYFAYSRLEPTKGVQYLSAGIDVGKYDEALAITLKQVADMAAGDFTAEEHNAALKGLINGYQSIQDTPYQVIDSYYTGLLNGRPRPVPEIAAQLAAVTKDEIVAVARGVQLEMTYFLRDRREQR